MIKLFGVYSLFNMRIDQRNCEDPPFCRKVNRIRVGCSENHSLAKPPSFENEERNSSFSFANNPNSTAIAPLFLSVYGLNTSVLSDSSTASGDFILKLLSPQINDLKSFQAWLPYWVKLPVQLKLGTNWHIQLIMCHNSSFWVKRALKYENRSVDGRIHNCLIISCKFLRSLKKCALYTKAIQNSKSRSLRFVWDFSRVMKLLVEDLRSLNDSKSFSLSLVFACSEQ